MKFAGPSAQRRVRSCESCFKSNSLIIVPPQGAWASEVGAPTPRQPLTDLTLYPPWSTKSFLGPGGSPRALGKRILGSRNVRAHALGFHLVFGTALGSKYEAFWPPKWCFLFSCCWSRGFYFWHCFPVGFRDACPQKLNRFRCCAKTAHMAFDP